MQPYSSELAGQHRQLEHEARQVEATQQACVAFLAANPGTAARITELERSISDQQRD